jgi:hypothetical protein
MDLGGWDSRRWRVFALAQLVVGLLLIGGAILRARTRPTFPEATMRKFYEDPSHVTATERDSYLRYEAEAARMNMLLIVPGTLFGLVLCGTGIASWNESRRRNRIERGEALPRLKM